jgi:hypothetical protein
MNSSFGLPPVQDPSTIQLALSLIGALSDPAGSKKRLQQLADGQAAYLAAKKGHDEAAAASAAASASLNDLTVREGKLADRGAELDQRATQLDVAASAHQARTKTLDDREGALADRERSLLARETAFTDRVQTLKQQLAS